MRPDFGSGRTNLRPERANLRPERADLRPERADLRPERADMRPYRPHLRPERFDLRGGQTNEQKSPCDLQDFVPFGAAALLSLTTILNHTKQGNGYR